MKQSEILRKAWALLSNPVAWSPKFCALDGLGDITSPTGKNAVKFCPVGAIHRAYKGSKRLTEAEGAIITLQACVGPNLPGSISGANERIYPDHTRLKAWFERAIDMAERKESA